MTVKEAAIDVLRNAGQPLTAHDICDRMLERGLWEPGGKTPHATVAARLYSDIKKLGDASAFVQVGAGTFRLRSGASTAPSTDMATRDSATGSTKTRRSSGKYSFTDAAEKVLEKYGGREPMHYRAITEKALDLDWIATEGKTPEATMYAQIIQETQRQKKRGDQPRFVQHGRGLVGLLSWIGTGLEFQIAQHNKRVRKALHKWLLALTPTEFEELISLLLAEIGFEDIEVTKRSGDGGIDVRGTLVVGDVVRTQMAVQAKKWKTQSRVQAPTVQQVRGSLGTHEQGLIITTSDFSSGARKEAARPNAVPVALMNGEQLIALMAQFGLGVVRHSRDLLELDDAHDPA